MGRSYAEKMKKRDRKKHDGSPAINKNGAQKEKFPIAPMVVLLIVVSLVVAAVVVYQQGGEEGGTPTNDDNGGDEDGPDHLRIGLESTSNGIIELSDHLGKVVVLDMFATWCGPCETQIDELKQLKGRYSSTDLVILSVDVDLRETLGQVRDFKSEHDAQWTFAASNEEFNSYFPAGSIPTLYILDREGKKVDEHVGVIKADGLALMIEPHL